MSLQTDIKWMKKAIEEAEKGVGMTRPNPPVGAVFVKNGRLVAAGYHKKAGADHAEKVALKKAGSRAAGTTAYVTLEPCSTYGRTPPCTEWLIEYEVKRVVIGTLDPNPIHNGNGIKILQDAGIETTYGICEGDCAELIRPFCETVVNKKPFVTLKLAMSADGKIADRRGASKWITGAVARNYVQVLRRRSDAVMVGVNTVIKDDPSLLPRPARGRKPFRIVVDSHARVPLKAQVLNDSCVERTIIAVLEDADSRKLGRIENKGAQVLQLPSRNGRVNLKVLMKALQQMGVMHVLCEGGGILAEQLLQDRLVNRLELFAAPCLLGGTAVPGVSGKGWLMNSKPVFTWNEVTMLGNDILMKADL